MSSARAQNYTCSGRVRDRRGNVQACGGYPRVCFVHKAIGTVQWVCSAHAEPPRLPYAGDWDGPFVDADLSRYLEVLEVMGS